MAQDGKMRGVLASTGAIPADLVEAFTGRWCTRMRMLEPEKLRVEIYDCLKPNVISHAAGRRAGARLSIWQRRDRQPLLEAE
jgi:hypothetical protein